MPTNLFIDEAEVVPLLTRMKLPRFVILEVLSSIAGERANVRDGYDPPSATGYETWRWGTRFLREHEVLKKEGWQICERDQVSGIFHPAQNMKLTVLPTDNSTGTTKKPKNITVKGPATCGLVDQNSEQGNFPFMKTEPPPPALWCLCMYFAIPTFRRKSLAPRSRSQGLFETILIGSSSRNRSTYRASVSGTLFQRNSQRSQDPL